MIRLNSVPATKFKDSSNSSESFSEDAVPSANLYLSNEVSVGAGNDVSAPHVKRDGSPERDNSAVISSEIAEELCLPPVKIHCSVLAEDAIKAAVNDYKKKNRIND